MGRVTQIVLSVSILALALAGCSPGSEPAPTQTSPAGNLAPDFQLESLDGQIVTLGALRGKPVMLNFWASWCGPCRAEMPYIQGVFEDMEWADKGLVILAVNVGESPSSAREFMEDNGLSFPVLLDIETSVARDYNVRGIPATFFIDKNGIIKDRKIGSFANKAEIDWMLLNSIMEGE